MQKSVLLSCTDWSGKNIREYHSSVLRSSGEKVRTGAVVITFPDQVPEFVHTVQVQS